MGEQTHIVMKTKLNLFAMFLGAMLLALPDVVNAQFLFTTNNGAITIQRYTGPGGAVVIPDTTNGYPITSIGTTAFQNLSVTSVTIGTNIVSIGNSAFNNCASLTGVTDLDSVTNIGANAFSGCSSLTNVIIGTNVISIGQFAFSLCKQLASVAIPNSVISLEKNAFVGCSGLTNATIGSNITSLDGTFNNCTGLASITIPNTITSITGAFSGCYRLTSITIPNSVTNVGPAAFSGCSGLTNITIGSNVTSIGTNAFYSCFRLTSIIIPNNVINLERGAFTGCSGLTSITIPDSVTTIGDVAFYGCDIMTNVLIGAGVTAIGNGAFLGDYSMQAFKVDTNNPAYSSLGGVLFNKSQTTLIAFPNGSARRYTIPTGVTSIGAYAFYSCDHLASVTIPNTVTNMGFDAFAFDYALLNIYFQGNAPSIDSTAFYNEQQPIAYYLPGTTGWETFNANSGFSPAVLWNPQAQNGDGSFGVQNNQFGFNISGTSNLVIVVEASTNLADSVWTPVSTNILTGGSSYFSDSQWTNYPGRFYRLRSQ